MGFCEARAIEPGQLIQSLSPVGPCVIARATSPLLICTPEGDFEPLQCGAGFPTQCQCVEPSDGTPVPDTLVMVEDPADLPDCDEEGKEVKSRLEKLQIKPKLQNIQNTSLWTLVWISIYSNCVPFCVSFPHYHVPHSSPHSV